MDLGVEGVMIEDKTPLTPLEKEQLFVDILPDVEVEDGVAYLSSYLADGFDYETLIAQIKIELEEIAQYVDIGSGEIEISFTEDVDWINNWKQYFHQFYIDDILITPSWQEVQEKDQDRLVIHIDPGTAFGTGMHETTQLCIRQLRKYVRPGDRVLDVGCGSGILAMLALKFGAACVIGTDLDPYAIEATHENMKRNDIKPDTYQVLIGNIIDDEQIQAEVEEASCDIIVANILADVLQVLTPVIIHHLKPGGVYITSGIIDTKEEYVSQCLHDVGFEILEKTRQGEWLSFTARKPIII